MEISILTGPAIGAVIGYFTNYIAVKMLFRPLRPVKIGGYTLPFTPGIIPKGKGRLAKALGSAVGNTLLTKEDMKEAMLSVKMLDSLDEMTDQLYESGEGAKTIQQYFLSYTDEVVYGQYKLKLIDKITVVLSEEINKLPVSEWVSERGTEVVMGQLDGLLAMMVSADMVRSIVGPAGAKLEEYIREEGYDLLWPLVKDKVTSVEDMTPGDALCEFGMEKDALKSGIRAVYTAFVEEKADDMLDKIQIGAIVENKINEMRVEDLETLVLSIMKKELGAVVNLGAVIGFLIGIIHIFI